MTSILNDLRFEAEMKIEDIKEQIAQIDWAQVFRTVVLAFIAFFKTDWAPYIKAAVRYFVQAIVWVYVAGYFLGTAVYAANDILSKLATRLLVNEEIELAQLR